MAEEINHLSFQESYHQIELLLENEYKLFRNTTNQLSTDQIMTHITSGEIIVITNKSQIP